MSGKRESFTERENAALREALRRYRKERRLTQAKMGALLGIKQQNVAHHEGKRASGLGRQTANALAVLLGYRDAEEFLIKEGVLAELQPGPTATSSTGASWSQRDFAVRLAERLHIDPVAVQAVVSRFTDDSSRHRPTKWWINKFYTEELERNADPKIPAPPESQVPQTQSSPQPKRRRA